MGWCKHNWIVSSSYGGFVAARDVTEANKSSAYLWQGRDGSPRTSTIAQDGSAFFAANVTAGTINHTQSSTTDLGVQLSAGGLVRVQRPSNATTNVPVFSGFNGDSENVTLNSDGSATFAGTVTADSFVTSGGGGGRWAITNRFSHDVCWSYCSFWLA
jgi:hypothetical protein